MTSNILWQAEELINGLDGKLVAGELSAANGISIDSRDIKHGDAFFAIKGDSFDGHDYTDKAANNGAAVIVISDEKYITKNIYISRIKKYVFYKRFCRKEFKIDHSWVLTRKEEIKRNRPLQNTFRN